MPIDLLQCFQTRLGTDQAVPLGLTQASMEKFYVMENAKKRKIFDDGPVNDAYGPRADDHKPWVWDKNILAVDSDTTPEVWPRHSSDGSASGTESNNSTDESNTGQAPDKHSTKDTFKESFPNSLSADLQRIYGRWGLAALCDVLERGGE